jgi:FkbM family methyltransferase
MWLAQERTLVKRSLAPVRSSSHIVVIGYVNRVMAPTTNILRIWRFTLMEYYSQVGQDRFLNETVFKGKEAGIFVDIGAHNGIEFSNSYFFEKYKNWNGICVEPLPDVYKELTKNRKCICIEGAICAEHGYQNFLQAQGVAEMLSGLVNEFDPRHVERIKITQQYYGGSVEVIPVATYPLQVILDSCRITHIDLCSIDTEGAELTVLKTIDFSKVKIECLTIENNFQETTIQNYLQDKGYILLTKLEFDDIYIHRERKYLEVQG